MRGQAEEKKSPLHGAMPEVAWAKSRRRNELKTPSGSQTIKLSLFGKLRGHSSKAKAEGANPDARRPPTHHPSASIVSGTLASTAFQTNMNSGQLTNPNVENIHDFNETYNELGLNTHLESYSVKQQLIRLANHKYNISNTKKLTDRIKDLETTIEINKQMLSGVLQSSGEDLKTSIYSNLTEENDYLKKRLNQLYSENGDLSNRLLLLEQINAEAKMKEHIITRQLEEQVAELVEKLEKKETYM